MGFWWSSQIELQISKATQIFLIKQKNTISNVFELKWIYINQKILHNSWLLKFKYFKHAWKDFPRNNRRTKQLTGCLLRWIYSTAQKSQVCKIRWAKPRNKNHFNQAQGQLRKYPSAKSWLWPKSWTLFMAPRRRRVWDFVNWHSDGNVFVGKVQRRSFGKDNVTLNILEKTIGRKKYP